MKIEQVIWEICDYCGDVHGICYDCRDDTAIRKYLKDSKKEKTNNLEISFGHSPTFKPTGVPEIDRILIAVARVCDTQHDTARWEDDIEFKYEGCVGDTPSEWIQNACDEAAKTLGKCN